ncbi:unnamed protein product [Urochloa humidicola]
MEGRLKGGGGSGGSSRLPPLAPPAAEPGRAGRPPTAQQQQQQVKVKHIVTRKVSTDQANFKDVVQRLTGKDSAAARAAVVAAGADAGTSWSSGATTSGGSGVSSGAAVAFEIENNVAGTMLPSEEDMRRWWHDP